MVAGSSRPVALVTGASRGIGKATALDLAAAGFDVAAAARTSRDGSRRSDTDPDVTLPGGLDTTVAQVEREGATGLAVTMDLLDRATVLTAVAATIERFGRLDVLVNNAIYQGPGTLARFADLTDGELSALFEGNVVAQLALIRAALPHLQDGGTVVNLVSGAGHLQPPAKVGEGGWSVGYAMTNDAGEYRIANLAVGRYLIAASNRNLGVGMVATSSKPSDKPEPGYPMVFYPNSQDAAGAAPVAVSAGAEVRAIDLRLAKSPAVRVAGHITGMEDAT